MTHSLRWLRVGSALGAVLSAPLLAHAQTATPATPPPESAGDSGGATMLFVILALTSLFVLVGVGVKMYDRRRKREEEGVGLQARLSDVLLLDPALSGVPIVATVHMPTWGASPPVVELSGTVPSEELRDIALHRIQQELGGREVTIEDHIAVDPRAARRVA